jgi:hypothetical protein
VERLSLTQSLRFSQFPRTHATYPFPSAQPKN